MASMVECEKNVKKFCENDEEINGYDIRPDDIKGLTREQNQRLRTSNYAHYYTTGVDRNCRPLKEND